MLLYAQKIDPAKQQMEYEKADYFFETGNFIQALDEYLKLEKKYPTDDLTKRKLGSCYANLHDDKSKVITYLRPIYNKGDYDDELLLELGIASQCTYHLDDAIGYYNMYRAKVSSKKQALVDHYIETCENAKVLMKKPVKVTFENLGKEVNSKYADYYPFVTKDEGTIYFTSRRDQNLGSGRSANGYFTSDIYVSTVKTGQWQKAKGIGAPINTTEDEEIVGLTPDGKNMIIYADRHDLASDLLHCEQQKNKNFNRPVLFNAPINTEGLELEGCYTADANTIYFSAVRKGGLGDADIYSSHRLPNGEWGTPQNLGPNINTPYKDGFPVVSEDGQTLFFASQGHTCMGGSDIFKAKWDANANTWGTAENIGYPVNTTDDDMMFSLADNGRDGYLSAWRKEGLGDLDIYKIVFQEVEQQLTAVCGTIKSTDSTQKEIEAFISIADIKTNTSLDAKNTNPKTGRYIFIVEPGKYRVQITSKGHKPYKEEITVFDKSEFTSEFEKNFKLEPEAK